MSGGAGSDKRRVAEGGITKLTDDFPMDVALDDAGRACRSAVAGLGWHVASGESNQIEVALKPGPTTWPSTKISISLVATTSARTLVTLDGRRIGGYGPVQKQHLRRSMSRLRDAILGNAEGIRLTDCTLLGGYGHDITPGTRCSAVFRADDVQVDTSGGERVVFRYEDIESLKVGGKGLVEANGGFIGGGFGAENALVGIGVASLLNSLASRSRIETIVNIKGRDRQAWLHYTHETPQALRIRLAEVMARIDSAQRRDPDRLAPSLTSVSEELARVHELHSQGVLTAEEYAAAKARLIERI